MVLEVGGTVITRQASDADVIAAIRSLAQQSEDEAFAILSSSDDTYIQTVRAEDGTFGLEYQVGSTDQHYGCYDLLDEDKIVRAFLAYQHGDPSVLSEFNWEKMDL